MDLKKLALFLIALVAAAFFLFYVGVVYMLEAVNAVIEWVHGDGQQSGKLDR